MPKVNPDVEYALSLAHQCTTLTKIITQQTVRSRGELNLFHVHFLYETKTSLQK